VNPRVLGLAGTFAAVATAAVLLALYMPATWPRILLLLAAVVVAALAWRRVLERQSAELRSLYTKLFHAEGHTARLEAEQEQSTEILSAMSDGVLVLDSTGHIVQANPAAGRLLNAPLENMRGERIINANRVFPALDLAREALTTGTADSRELTLPGARRFSVETVPLRTTLEGETTVLLLIRDETEEYRTDSIRRDFVSNVSHELKTPLAGISLLAATLQHAIDEDPTAAKGFAARMDTEINWLNGLVEDLLTLSRFEDPAPTEAGEVLDLAELVRTVRDEAGSHPAAQGRTVSLHVPSPVLVVGNRTGMEAAVRNLLGNALRFTNPGGHVELAVVAADDSAVLTVRDDGIGIPRDEQTRIFERFYRVDKARSRETGGTGLGLSIVRHVVEQHGGSIEVESTLGLGSTFTVRLPLAAAATPH
jgi:signal transduction histidine kinase